MQERMIADDRGWIRKKVLTALAPGTIEDLKALDWKAGQEVIGKVVVKESLEPFNPKDPERDLKIAGETGVVCTKDNQPIYRKTFFSFNPATQDELVPHTNKEEIKKAYEALEAAKSTTAAESLEK